ncbi:Bug family tripartite tricarboxylate transporter substrate binding protein [Cupriavidus oxalaticus]|uniref:Bug family tripartite tricarboxylate transporter substrate binding protein n=1 Tax=Cupriavidus oxalaticus TaxID=96344 RepID=UPI00403399ED
MKLLAHSIGVALATLACVASASDASFPSKPIRLVIPFPAGGGSDTIARIVTAKASQTLKQSIVIDNRPGAGGTIATASVAHAPADGYTLLVADTPLVANLSIYGRPGYALKDFAPITVFATSPTIVVVSASVPANNIQELVALAKRQPGKLNMASGGAGGMAHLMAARFAMETGINWTHVPYRGMAPALIDVAAGQADVMFASAPSVVPQLKGGRLKPLAVNAATRSRLAPNIPSIAELGFPQLAYDNWYGVVAPAGTDPAIIKKLYEHFRDALKDPEVVAKLNDQMATAAPSESPKQFGQVMHRDYDLWANTVKTANITAQ